VRGGLRLSLAAVGGRTVFISYRRQLSWPLARLIYQDLTEHGFDAFIDVEILASGEFEWVILSQIQAREHFVVVLVPGSLDQIGEDGDWLRREVAHALAQDRNVVPVTLTDSSSAATSYCHPTWPDCAASMRSPCRRSTSTRQWIPCAPGS
jgi:hypothetical protein